jgi:hypothetical protein
MPEVTSTPAVTKFLDFLSGSVPRFVAKHPALVAGGVGVGLGAAAMRRKAYQTEASIQNERLGAPTSKYVYAELKEFDDKKEFLSVKCAFEKSAEGPWGGKGYDTAGDLMKSKMVEGVGGGVGKAVGEQGIGGIRRLLGAGAQAIKEKFFADPKRDQILQDVLTNDPDIAAYHREKPEGVQQAYDTMRRFAPTLSTDPNVVTAFLRGAAMLGGPLDYNVIKGLADAESSVQKAHNEGAWGTGR